MGILYKYYGLNAGLAALKNKSIGFRFPSNLNDPLEFLWWLKYNDVDTKIVENLLDKVGVLSLSKCPNNTLMWSHYAENHRGIVIGYDDNSSIFSEKQIDTIFDANTGLVCYGKPGYLQDAKEATKRAAEAILFNQRTTCDPDATKALKGIFLSKQIDWRYEKEVRIVKLIENIGEETIKWREKTGNNWRTISTRINENTSIIDTKGLSIKIDEDLIIKEVILGLRNPLIYNTNKNINENFNISKIKIDSTGNLKCEVVDGTFDWTPPKTIVKKILTPSEMSEVLKHTNDPRISRSNLVISTLPSKKPESWFEEE